MSISEIEAGAARTRPIPSDDADHYRLPVAELAAVLLGGDAHGRDLHSRVHIEYVYTRTQYTQRHWARAHAVNGSGAPHASKRTGGRITTLASIAACEMVLAASVFAAGILLGWQLHSAATRAQRTRRVELSGGPVVPQFDHVARVERVLVATAHGQMMVRVAGLEHLPRSDAAAVVGEKATATAKAQSVACPSIAYVFVHDALRSSDEWSELMPLFARVACCFAPDLIGCGDSDKRVVTMAAAAGDGDGDSACQITLRDYAAHIETLLQMYRVQRVVLFGSGAGAAVALAYAAHASREHVHSLVLGNVAFDRWPRRREDRRRASPWPAAPRAIQRYVRDALRGRQAQAPSLSQSSSSSPLPLQVDARGLQWTRCWNANANVRGITAELLHRVTMDALKVHNCAPRIALALVRAQAHSAETLHRLAAAAHRRRGTRLMLLSGELALSPAERARVERALPCAKSVRVRGGTALMFNQEPRAIYECTSAWLDSVVNGHDGDRAQDAGASRETKAS